MAIQFNEDFRQAQFIKRENRFIAQMKVDNKEVRAYVPNPGRMEELLIPGQEMVVAYKDEAHRKTDYELALIKHQGELVSINSQLPNKVVEDALLKQELEAFQSYSEIKREYTYGDSRIDFKLTGQNKPCLVEVKSVTLVEDGVAKFPDAPTKRGRRHLQELIKAVKNGYRAAVVFIIQRSDAEVFTPNDRIDLKFGDTLRRAAEENVGVFAYICGVNLEKIGIKGRIAVNLEQG